MTTTRTQSITTITGENFEDHELYGTRCTDFDKFMLSYKEGRASLDRTVVYLKKAESGAPMWTATARGMRGKTPIQKMWYFDPLLGVISLYEKELGDFGGHEEFVYEKVRGQYTIGVDLEHLYTHARCLSAFRG